jgi:hypothetical protein
VRLSLEIEFDFIDVAPAPLFAGFDGAHDWMPGLVEMFGGVFIFRGVAAAYVSADQTHAEVDPTVAGFEALFAALGMGMDVLDLIEVGTCGSHTE